MTNPYKTFSRIHHDLNTPAGSSCDQSTSSSISVTANVPRFQPPAEHDQTPAEAASSYAESLSDYPPASPRVHFHSRVRITSGIPRCSTSSSSSPSASCSSSISAPLRSHADVPTSFGPLGQRTRLLAWRNAGYGASRVDWGRRPWAQEGPSHERSPLNHPYCHSPHIDVCSCYPGKCTENLHVFGPWPARLINPLWWWWQLEPILCCHPCRESAEFE